MLTLRRRLTTLKSRKRIFLSSQKGAFVKAPRILLRSDNQFVEVVDEETPLLRVDDLKLAVDLSSLEGNVSRI